MTWPDPSATALDRARAIARTYRAALARANPQQAALLDDAARRVGETWIVDPSTTSGQLCTVAEAAALLGVTDRRVRQLIPREIPSAGKTAEGHVLRVPDVLAYQARQRALARRATSALPSDASG